MDRINSDTLFKIIGSSCLFIAFVVNQWTLSLILHPFSIFLRHSSRVLIGLTDILLVTVGVVLITVNPKAVRKYLSKVFKLIVSLSICFVLLEIFLRWYTPTPVFHSNLALYPFRELNLHVQLYGVSEVVHHTTNKWGMRGDPVPDNWDKLKTILAVGGSTTQCYYLSDDKTWPARLQEKLRKIEPEVMVQNAGLDGHSTVGHLLLMEKVVPILRPDIILLLVGHNDLGRSMSEQLIAFGNPRERTGFGYYIFSHSRSVQILQKWYQILINKVPRVEEAVFGDPNGFVAMPISNPTPLPDPLESMLPTLADFRTNVIAIIDLARTMGSKPIFLTQPSLFGDTEYWNNILLREYWFARQKYVLSSASFSKLLRIFNEELLRICAEKGVDCFDLASSIPKKQEYFYDSSHFNEAGSELVAEDVYKFIKDRRVLDFDDDESRWE